LRFRIARQAWRCGCSRTAVRKFAIEQRRGYDDALPAPSGNRRYPWPGNVRELENVVKRAVIMADTASITAADIGLGVTNGGSNALNLRHVGGRPRTRFCACSAVNGNLSKATELLGVSVHAI
jgi:two-component system NtrC family response regulator